MEIDAWSLTTKNDIYHIGPGARKAWTEELVDRLTQRRAIQDLTRTLPPSNRDTKPKKRSF
jgi:hypothetical protein